METTQPTQEQKTISPIGDLRCTVIEAQIAKLFPWADEMAGNDYIISVDDAKSVVEATVQEINSRELFRVSPNYDEAQELIGRIAESIERAEASKEIVTVTAVVDVTIMICDGLLDEEKINKREE